MKTADVNDEFLSDLTKATEKPKREGAKISRTKENDLMAQINAELRDQKKERTEAITFHAPEHLASKIEKHRQKLGLKSRSTLLVKILEKFYEDAD